MAKNNVYAVLRGRETGIFHSYEECKEQVHEYKNACYKSFSTEEEAMIWLEKGGEGMNKLSANILRRMVTEIEMSEKEG